MSDGRRMAFRRLLAVSLALASLISGCGLASAAATDSSTVLKVAIDSFSSTNPFTFDAGSQRILGLIYDTATKTDPATGELVPYIAVGSASRSADTTSVAWKDCAVGSFECSPESAWEDPGMPEIIIFYDFEGVYWHDGVQMSIRDIMFSFHAHASEQISWLGNPLMDLAGGPGSNYSESKWLHIQKAWESEDGSRAALRFVLQSDKFSAFQTYLTATVLPYHIWAMRSSGQESDNAKIWCDPEFNISDEYSWKRSTSMLWSNPWPVGSGPFAWAGRVGDRITLVPWSGYFYRPGFKYYIQGADVSPIPRMASVTLTLYRSNDLALRDLTTGKLDLIAWPQESQVLTAVQDSLDIEQVSLRSTRSAYVGFNMARESFGYVIGLDGPGPMGSDHGQPLRKALVHCMNTQSFMSLANPNTRSTAALAPLKSWENASAPAYSFDPSEAVNILRKAGYVLEDPERPPGPANCWLNADGTPIGGGSNGAVRLVVADAGEDQVMYQSASMITSQMRGAGIRTDLVATDLVTVMRKLNLGEFDMFILSQDFPEVYRSRPDIYYCGAFHSFSTEGGLNYFGYANNSLDRILDRAAAADGPEAQRVLVKEAMAAVAYDVPMHRLYYVSNVEIYRSSSIEGLVDDGSGSLLNPRSVASAFRQEKPVLTARFTAMPMTAISNSTFPVSVSVTDRAGRPMQGAYVIMEASSGVLWNTTGQTDASGRFTTNFTAPYLPMLDIYHNWEAVTFRMTSATLAGYRQAKECEFVMTVFPEWKRQMALEATVVYDTIPETDQAGEPGFTYVTVRASDPGGIAISGAEIIVAYSGGQSLGEERLRTDQDGIAILRIAAPDVVQDTGYVINFTASRPGFINASCEVEITVTPVQPPAVAVTGGVSPAEMAAATAAAVLLALASVLWLRRVRRRGR